MSSIAILSIKPVYANQILDGSKTIELRKSTMGLAAEDIVLVYSSAPEQRLAFWFRIEQIEVLPVDEMWAKHTSHLGIAREDYEAYFAGSDLATGLHVGELHRIEPVPLAAIRDVVDSFVPPQGMIWLRGRYEQLLSRLSDPPPMNQLSLALG